MNMVIVPSHADEGSPIDMFTGINNSSLIMNQSAAPAFNSENSSSYLASNSGGANELVSAVELQEAAEREAKLIEKL